ncbi:uncharacterized protein MPTK1_2g19400 [Marchantia polymorpha subsp. ruderalis]|uniref:Sulfite exporter TauE/SafE family protein n=2 Tax=Marchantia polymorpha TaxID=3197 RepID=A0A176VYY5_MARPO|nr:hypothetical protein AXG93_812s1080 [Marchantia polymorpha subsp. ruderalis]PTQ37862.1 hypothetical protein MARPO_0055s0112 [Marchantia polymorpha]BBN02930.1 hypothetical protein Mp_2g19400 [Marchantia polymorpha subsp. ruderalis]|eukprot:PTQ37862.1 hypothetical protein MARPO_0055s0112 [Marchantia polymorpha]
MAEFVITRIRMPRQRFSGYFTCVCVVLVFLMHLASAERLMSSRRDAGADSLDLLLGAGNQNGMVTKSVSDQYGSGDEAASSASSSSSSMAPIDRHSFWFKGMENLSHRIFQLGAEEEVKWPELKLTQLRTILGIVFGGIGAGLSSAGGLGGGGLFVPLFNLMLQFDPKTSAALSNFMILGGSIVNLIINLRQHHPFHKSKPVIDFDVLLLMQPNMLLGISIGVIFNVILPSWLITALLALVLGYMTFHSMKGGLKRWSKESQQNQARKEALEAQARAPVSVSISPPADESEVTAAAAAPNFSVPTSEEAAADGPKDSLTTPLLLGAPPAGPPRPPKLIPRRKIAALVVVWLAFFSVQVLRGGKSDSPSVLGFEKCGIGYWALTSTQIPLALILTAWTINQLRQYHGAPNKDNAKVYDIQEEGYVLGPDSATLFPWMALVAGVLGGMLGIGGGMIINPLLFSVGMLPQVTAATCASMVFFSSSMSVIQYWLMGRIPLQYALISAVLCAIFSWFGIVIVHKAIEKYNRASLIVFSVAAVMGVSAVLMCGFGGYDVWRQYIGGGYMGFHYPC